jgi:hypothetical protein
MVFISWSSRDGDAAQRVLALLERSGLRTWISSRDLASGRDYAEVISEVIPTCAAMLLLVSDASLHSDEVRSEVGLARRHRLRIFPVGVEGFSGLESLRGRWAYLLEGKQVATSRGLEEVVAEIAAELQGADGHADTAKGSQEPDSRRPRRSTPRRSGVARTPVQVARHDPQGFVGPERQEILDSLTATWRRVTDHGESHLVILLGETGFGKTRIVQELYRRVAAGQPQPGFWPPDLSTATSHGQQALRESRKRIAPPDLDPPEGASACYLWLGHVVDEGREGRVDLGLQQVASDLARALSLATLRQPDGAGAQMVAAALEQAPKPLADLQLALAEFMHTGPRGDVGSSATPGSLEAFWQGIGALWAGVGEPLPTVIVIEDGHFAGEQTVQLLDQLATSAGLPFLIVVCALESRLGGRGAGEDVHGRRALGRLIEQHLPAVSVHRLSRLAEADVESLLREALPELDDETMREVVVKVDGNPYHAHTLLIEMIRMAAQGRLDSEWVRQRPGSFEGELRAQWYLLPDDVRRVLSGIAVLGTQVPERIGLRAVGAVYDRDPLADVDASVETGWLRRLRTDEVLRFLERPRWVIANEESFEEWDVDDRRQIIEEALGSLEAIATGAGLADPLLQELHLALALAADEEGIPFARVAAVRSGLACAMRLRLASDDHGSLSVARDTDVLVVGHEEDPGMGELGVEVALVIREAVGKATREESVSASEEVVRRARGIAVRRPDLMARALAALARSHRVRYDAERLAYCRDALFEAETWLARCPAPDVFARTELLHARAMVAHAKGDDAESAVLSERRLGLMERAFGPLDRRSMLALSHTSFYWNRVNIERAITLKRELLNRRRRVWGFDCWPPAVATATKELSYALVRSQDQSLLPEAEAMSRAALGALAEARGAHHRTTILARGEWVLAACRLSDQLEQQGDTNLASSLRLEALDAARDDLDCLEDRARPATRILRTQRVAHCLIRLGDADGIAMLQRTLELQETPLPPSFEVDENDADAPMDIEILWTVAEMVAGHIRLGDDAAGEALASAYGLVREERWPAFQPRGWRSTRPEHARVGVL